MACGPINFGGIGWDEARSRALIAGKAHVNPRPILRSLPRMLAINYILKTTPVDRRGRAASINHAGLQAPSKSCLQRVRYPKRGSQGRESPH